MRRLPVALLGLLLIGASTVQQGPPPPEGFSTRTRTTSPKGKEFQASLGKQMTVAKPKLSFVVPPIEFLITNITASGNQVTLSWNSNSAGPYQVLVSDSLNGPWSTAGDSTILLNSTIPAWGNSYWKVQAQIPLLFLNPTNQPRLTWDVPTIDMSDTLGTFTIQRSTDGTTFSNLVTLPNTARNYSDPAPIPASGFWYKNNETTVNGAVIPYPVVFAPYPAVTPGTARWVKGFSDTTLQNNSSCVAIEPATGAIIFAGSFPSGGTVNYGKGPFTSAGGSDIVLAKYSTSGVCLWAYRYGSTGSEAPVGISLQLSAGVIQAIYVTGTVINNNSWVLSGFDGTNPVSAGAPHSPTVSPDFFISKYSATGTPIWAKYYGGLAVQFGQEFVGGTETGSAIAVDSNGDIFCIGTFSDRFIYPPPVDDNDVYFNGSILYNDSAGTPYVIKFSGTDGTYIHSRKLAIQNTSRCKNVLVDSAGNIYVCGGGGAGGVDWQDGHGIVTPSEAGWPYIIKMSGATLATIWVKAYTTGPTSDKGAEFYCMAFDPTQQYIYLGGKNKSSVLNFGGPQLQFAGLRFQAFAVKLNTSDGSYGGWQITNVPTGDYLNTDILALAVDPSGSLYVAGTFIKTFTFGNFVKTAVSFQYDTFISKFTGANQDWVTTISPTQNYIGNPPILANYAIATPVWMDAGINGPVIVGNFGSTTGPCDMNFAGTIVPSAVQPQGYIINLVP